MAGTAHFVGVASAALVLGLLAGYSFAGSADDNATRQDARNISFAAGISGRQTVPTGETDKRQLISDLTGALNVMIPEARAMASGQQQNADAVATIDELRNKGLLLAGRNDLDQALALLDLAHANLQSYIVSHRPHGDRVVKLPTAGDEQAWLDSKRRYEDWLFVSNWLMTGGSGMELDTHQLSDANRQAAEFYEQASRLAQVQQWEAASRLMDKAYVVLEATWRSQGIDV